MKIRTAPATSLLGGDLFVRSAAFSDDEVYRYALRIPEDPSGTGALLAVMLNPSTADEMKDDPTVRRVRGLASRRRMRWTLIANLFALRSTDPKALRTHPDPVGPENDEHIRAMAREAELVLVGWGVLGCLQGRDQVVTRLLQGSTHAPIVCWGRTQDGAPRHPLYCANATPLEEWRPPARNILIARDGITLPPRANGAGRLCGRPAPEGISRDGTNEGR